MADYTIPTITLAPRGRGEKVVTVTATNEVTVFITDKITVFVTKTIETTTSIFDTTYIHVTDTITTTLTSVKPTTITQNQTVTQSQSIPTITTLIPQSTPSCSTIPAHVFVEKHIDPFRILSIAFGIFILLLLLLMWFLVRRFYKMYRAERVMRKQIQTEGTEMPPMKMPVNEREMHVVGEES